MDNSITFPEKLSLSETQRSIWIHQKLYPESNVFNIPVLFGVDTDDEEAIGDAIRTVVNGYDILHCIFFEEDGMPFQKRMSGDRTISPARFRISGGEGENEMREFVQRRFSLSEGPLYRFAIIYGEGRRVSVLMVFHHLVTDGSSLFYLGKKIRSLAEKGNGDGIAKEDIIHYEKYIRDEQEYLSSERCVKDREFLLNQFPDGIRSLTLPYDLTYSQAGGKSSSQKAVLDEKLTRSLHLLAARWNTSVYTLLLSCYYILLYRLSGEQEIAVGMPVINRSRQNRDKQGLFLNTIVVPAYVDSRLRIAEFIGRVRSALMTGIRHKDYPYGRLISESGRNRGGDNAPSHTIFFNGLSFFDDFIAAEAFGAFRHDFGLDVNFDLNCYAGITEKNILLQFDYRTSIFHNDTVAHFIEKFKFIIEFVAANPEKQIAEIAYSTAIATLAERGDAKWYSPDRTITEVFRYQSGRYPERIAVKWKTVNLSYKDLDERSEGFAELIRQRSRDKRIGIWLENSHLAAIAVIGILKAGKSYLAIGREATSGSIAQMLSDAGCTTVIVDGESAPGPEGFLPGIKIIDVNEAGPPVAPQEDHTRPGDEAYLIFTSGSSGKAKAVSQSHQHLLHFISQYTTALHISEEDRLTGFSPVSYDSFNNDFWGAVLNGGVYCPLSLSGAGYTDMFQWITDHAITIWHSIPGLFRMYAEVWDRSGVRCPFRIVKMTGEAVRSYDFELFKKVTTERALFFVSLGSTESTLSCINSFSHADHAHRALMPVGYPVDRTKITVVGDDGEERDLLEPGELVVESDYFCEGYLNDPESDARTFRSPRGRRCYFTGDMGVIRPDGRIEWTGRKDAVIKINGIRIDTAAIEELLLKVKAVEEVVVMAKKEDAFQPSLYCYYSSAGPLNEIQLTEVLSQTIPSYAIPSVFVWVKEFPRLSNGKISRKALPDPVVTGNHQESLVPQGDRHLLMRDIWANILGMKKEDIGIDNNFFRLGGNSLMAIQLAHRIHRAFSKEFQPREIFTWPTIRQQLMEMDGKGSGVEQPIPAAPPAPDYPLSGAQQRIWILSQLEGGSRAYNISTAVEINGRLDMASFEAAWKAIIDRHEILRTIFITVEGLPRQKILNFSETGFNVEFLQAEDADRFGQSTQALLDSKANSTFALDRPPLMRVCMIRHTIDKSILLLTMHHMISDGWSMNILVEELLRDYHLNLHGQEAAADPLRVQYKDYSNWQKQSVQSGLLAGQRAYWLKQFEDSGYFTGLPVVKRRPERQTFNGRRRKLPLDAALVAEIRTFANNHDLTVFMTLLSVVKALLYKYTGGYDLVVGAPVAGRDHYELEGQVGFYTNMLALRTRFERTDTFKDLAGKVRATVLNAFGNSRYPFDGLINDLRAVSNTGRGGLFDMMVKYDNLDQVYSRLQRLPDLVVSRIDPDHRYSQFDIAFCFEEAAGAIGLNLDYNTDLFDDAAIEGVKNYFFELLDLLVGEPETRLDQIKILLREEENPETRPEPVLRRDFVAPVSDTSKRIASIFGELLGLPEGRIGHNDDLFDIGGNSLTAVQAIHKITRAFGVQIPYTLIHKGFFVDRAEEYILRHTKGGYDGLPRAGRKLLYPATPAQAAIHRFQELNKESIAYNIYTIVQLDDAADVASIEGIVNQLIKRHESLRTSFVYRGRRLYQKVAATARVKVNVVNADSIGRAEVKKFIKVFDLKEAPLLEVILVDSRDGRHLIINAHHIVCDGLSVNILIGEFNRLYRGDILRGTPFQFRDYSEWYHSAAVKERTAIQKKYWMDLYSRKAGGVIDLPADYPGSRLRTFNGSRARLILPAQDAEFSFVFAVYAIFLYKITMQKDFFIGCPVAGRSHADAQEIVGMFVNTLAIPVSLNPAISFSRFFSEIQQLSAASFEHQDFPAENDTGDRVYNVALVFNNFKQDQLSFGTAGGGSDEEIYSSSKFDLTLYCDVKEGHIAASLIFNRDLFLPDTIEKWKAYLYSIWEQAVRDASLPIRDISILAPAEKRQIMEEFSKGRNEAVNVKSLYEKVFHASILTPDRPAVKYYEREMSFGELIKQADLCYRRLRVAGCGATDVIALSAQPCAELVIGVLAINRLGGTVLPLDLGLPEVRLRHMLEDSGARCLLTNDLSAEGEILSWSDRSLNISVNIAYSPGDLSLFDRPEHPYIVYTSGTTGDPKGILIKSESLVNYLQWFQQTTGISEYNETVLLSSFSFDLCYTAFYSALFNAQRIHLLRREDYLNPGFLMDYLIAHGIHYLKLTPSHFSHLVVEKQRFSQTALRWIVLGGEKIGMADVEAVHGVNPLIQFMNHYGPAETTIGTIHEIIGHDEPEFYRDRTVIGKPIFNNEVYVLSEELTIQPIGLKGEICIAGKGLSAGYLDAAGQTSDKFAIIGDLSGKLVYRTGDMGRWLPEGKIEFIGRKDRQVKLNGYRIEVAEVERALLLCSDATHCAVVVRSVGDRQMLVAYLVGSGALDISAIKGKLNEHLPFYMLPGRICQIRELPLTFNGKIDILRLPEPSASDAPGGELSATEKQLARIWSDILQLAPGAIGHHESNFFELGGNSVSAVQLLGVIRGHFGKEVRYRSLYLNGSLRQLSNLIQWEGQPTGGLAKADNAAFYPASDAQKRMFLENSISPQSLDYNKLYVIKLISDISFQDVDNAFRSILQRHAVFRTTFHLRGNDIVQQKEDNVVFDISYDQINAGSLDQYALSFCRPFRLGRLPLIRIKYLSVQGDTNVLLLDTHHITSDGLSMILLLKEFIRHLENVVTPVSACDYIDYTQWLSTPAAIMKQNTQRSFWEQEFNERAYALPLPFHNKSDSLSGRTRRVTETLDEEWHKIIDDFVREKKYTHYSFFLGCLSILLGKLSTTSSILLGVMLDGRDIPDVRDIVGMFVNTLPFKVNVGDGRTAEGILEEVNRKILDYYDMQGYALQHINEDYKRRHGVTLSDKLNILFEFNNYSLLLDEYKHTISLDEMFTGYSRSGIIVRVLMGRNNFSIQIKYPSGYRDSDVQNFLQQYRQLIYELLSGGLGAVVTEVGSTGRDAFDFTFDI